MGGDLKVASAGLGKGTTFILNLPADIVVPDSPAHRVASAANNRRVLLANVRPRTGTVVVVDDNTLSLRILGSMLSQLGVRHVLFSDARQALAFQEDGNPIAFWLCDLWMPELSGLDVLHRIGGEVPVVIASAEEASNQVMEAGAKGFVMKPLRLVDLQTICDAFLIKG